MTPLIILNERVAEISARSPDEEINIEDGLDNLFLSDKLPALKKKSSRSLSVKRHHMELGSSQQSDILSVLALKTLIANVDYKSLNTEQTQNYNSIGNFAVLINEISDTELKNISSNFELEIGNEPLIIRVIKPFTQFYNELISIVLRYGIQNFQTVNSCDFLEAAQNSMKELWKPFLIGPTNSFYEWCKTEGNVDSGELFENLKYSMNELWEAEIINTTNRFKKVKQG